MEEVPVELIAASVAFVGTHFAMSHPLRAPMVKVLSAGGFMIAYSLVSAATMAWMYFAFVGSPAGAPLWGEFGDAVWIAASVITLLAMVLFAGSLIGNPALPAPGAEKAALREPGGVFKVTRHPMMWGFALWAISHLIAAPTARTVVVALAIGVLALVGAHMQDRKKEALMGAAWAQWEIKTSYWPQLHRIVSVGLVPWTGGIAIWLGASWLHKGVEAGLWRWL